MDGDGEKEGEWEGRRQRRPPSLSKFVFSLNVPVEVSVNLGSRQKAKANAKAKERLANAANRLTPMCHVEHIANQTITTDGNIGGRVIPNLGCKHGNGRTLKEIPDTPHHD